EQPDLGVESTAPTRDQLELLNSRLTEKTQELRTQLGDLLRPFRAESVQRLIGRCKENLPESRLGREIEAFLKTPFLRASDRQELWKAGLDLDRRLEELLDRDSGSSADAGASADRLQAVSNLVGRRKEWLLALLKMADPKSTFKVLEPGGIPSGKDARADQPKEAEERTAGEPLAQTWGDLAQFTRTVHSRITDALHRGERAAGPDRPAWIAPAFMLDEKRNPIRQSRDRECLAAWTWLAARYRHESQDLQGLLDPPNTFFDSASLELPRKSEIRPEPRLRLSIPEQASTVRRLSSRQPTADVEVQLILDGTDAGTSEKSQLRPSNPVTHASRCPSLNPPRSTWRRRRRNRPFCISSGTKAREAGPTRLPRGSSFKRAWPVARRFICSCRSRSFPSMPYRGWRSASILPWRSNCRSIPSG